MLNSASKCLKKLLLLNFLKNFPKNWGISPSGRNPAKYVCTKLGNFMATWMQKYNTKKCIGIFRKTDPIPLGEITRLTSYLIVNMYTTILNACN
jgi:hypothetical protein